MGLASRLSSSFRRLRTDAGPHFVPPPSTTEEVVRLAYRAVLGREADAWGLQWWGSRLDSGEMSRDQLITGLVESAEFRSIQRANATIATRSTRALEALHRARVQAVKQLPRARRILDLGGSWEGMPQGAMLVMGYPYHFDSLTIIDLPRDQRHEIYSEICGEYPDVIPTPQGPVNYVYTSLADLSAFADESFDLVYSGQSIEHVTRDDAAKACQEAYRVLRPGGSFCLDTPNRAITVLQSPDAFINPDHEHEYTHQELSSLLERHGFIIREAKGLNRAAESLARGEFLIDELIDNPGLYDEIEACYLLFYRCQKPG